VGSLYNSVILEYGCSLSNIHITTASLVEVSYLVVSLDFDNCNYLWSSDLLVDH
jgi:hypothetical protein